MKANSKGNMAKHKESALDVLDSWFYREDEFDYADCGA
jgi:hypothetical protein